MSKFLHDDDDADDDDDDTDDADDARAMTLPRCFLQKQPSSLEKCVQRTQMPPRSSLSSDPF